MVTACLERNIIEIKHAYALKPSNYPREVYVRGNRAQVHIKRPARMSALMMLVAVGRGGPGCCFPWQYGSMGHGRGTLQGIMQ